MDENLKVLEMLAEGTITAEQAEMLLAALSESTVQEEPITLNFLMPGLYPDSHYDLIV